MPVKTKEGTSYFTTKYKASRRASMNYRKKRKTQHQLMHSVDKNTNMPFFEVLCSAFRRSIIHIPHRGTPHRVPRLVRVRVHDQVPHRCGGVPVP